MVDKESVLLEPERQASDIAGNATAAEHTLGNLTTVNSDGFRGASGSSSRFGVAHLAANVESLPMEIGAEQTVVVLHGHSYILLGS